MAKKQKPIKVQVRRVNPAPMWPVSREVDRQLTEIYFGHLRRESGGPSEAEFRNSYLNVPYTIEVHIDHKELDRLERQLKLMPKKKFAKFLEERTNETLDKFKREVESAFRR